MASQEWINFFCLVSRLHSKQVSGPSRSEFFSNVIELIFKIVNVDNLFGKTACLARLKVFISSQGLRERTNLACYVSVTRVFFQAKNFNLRWTGNFLKTLLQFYSNMNVSTGRRWPQNLWSANFRTRRLILCLHREMRKRLRCPILSDLYNGKHVKNRLLSPVESNHRSSTCQIQSLYIQCSYI